jgi:hypothetical protein
MLTYCFPWAAIAHRRSGDVLPGVEMPQGFAINGIYRFEGLCIIPKKTRPSTMVMLLPLPI